ncbi:MAG: protein kinase domain-containing protein [Solirubrobacteraceae bacterium]
MGVVYRATQISLERTVALKLVAPELAVDEGFRERFKRESKLAASIDHPHVIAIFEAGESDGQLYVTMRFVDGIDLDELIAREGALAPERAAAIVAQVASALDAAHARGLVHRDIKPANVLLAQAGVGDHAFLTDFGLTKRVEGTERLTQTGQWIGTLDYAAPEQIGGQGVDARTDVYALGCLLFKAVTGRVPFAREEDVAKLWAHVNDAPPAPSATRVGVPPALDDVVRRALAKQAEQRYPSAGDLGRAAVAAVEGASAAPERSVAAGSAAPGASGAGPPAAPSAPAPSPGGAPTATTLGQPTELQPLAGAGAVPPDPASRPRALPLVFLAVLAGVVVLVVAVVALASLLGGGDESDALKATSFEVKAIAVGESPAGLAFGEGAAWVALDESEAIRRLDPDTGQPGPPIKIGEGVDGKLAVGEGAVWVRSGSSTVTKVDADSDQVQGNPIEVGIGSDGDIAVGEGTVWTVNTADGTLSRIDPGAGAVKGIATIPAGTNGSLAVGEGAVWVVNRDRPTITKVNPDSGRPQGAPITVGTGEFFTGTVAAGQGSVWVVDPDEDLLVRIDPDSGRRTGRPTKLPEGFDGDVTVGGGAVWVASSTGATVVRVDPSTGKVVGGPVAAGAEDAGVIAIGGGFTWVSNPSAGTVTRLRY